MIQSNADKANDRETQVRKALADIQSGKYKSTKSAARAYSLSDNMLHYRMASRNSCASAQQSQQILSETEENILVQWITRFTCAGFPTSPSLVMQMAEKVCHEHVHLRNDTNTSDQFARPISHNWLYQFESKHPELAGIWIKSFAQSQFNETNHDVVRHWFNAVTKKWLEHQYPSERVYNMDESSFAIGTNQSSRVLINVRESSN